MPAVCHFSQFSTKFILSEVPFAETVPELILSWQGLISETYILLFSFHGLSAPVHLGALFFVELHQIKDFLCQFPRMWWAALTQPDSSRMGTAECTLYLPALLHCLATGLYLAEVDLRLEVEWMFTFTSPGTGSYIATSTSLQGNISLEWEKLMHRWNWAKESHSRSSPVCQL